MEQVNGPVCGAVALYNRTKLSMGSENDEGPDQTEGPEANASVLPIGD